MRCSLIIAILLACACGTIYMPPVGKPISAGADLAVLSDPYGFVSEAEYREKTVGVIPAGQTFEIRDSHYQRTDRWGSGTTYFYVASLEGGPKGWVLADELRDARSKK